MLLVEEVFGHFVAFICSEVVVRGIKDSERKLLKAFASVASSILIALFIGWDPLQLNVKWETLFAFTIIKLSNLHKSPLDVENYRRERHKLGHGIALNYWIPFLRPFNKANKFSNRHGDEDEPVHKVIIIPKRCEFNVEFDQLKGFEKQDFKLILDDEREQYRIHGRNPIQKDVFRINGSKLIALDFPQTLQSSLGRRRVPESELREAHREVFLRKIKSLLALEVVQEVKIFEFDEEVTAEDQLANHLVAFLS